MIWMYWKINHIVLSKAVVSIANEWIKHQINFLSKHESNGSAVFLLCYYFWIFDLQTLT